MLHKACKIFLFNSIESVQLTQNFVKRSFHKYALLNNDQVYASSNSTSKSLPSHCQIVIAGAGTVANSVAYHLVKNGWTDVAVLEQNKIGSGTSHFGSGTLGLLKPLAHRNLISYSIKLYKELQDMGYDVGFKRCGSLNLAQTSDRMIVLKRRVAYNRPTGLMCKILGKDDLREMHPYLNVDDIEGGVWVPDDIVADPAKVCEALATLSEKGGALYVEDCYVQDVHSNSASTKTVKTDKGVIQCEYFVNCAGMWARELGLRCHPPVKIPVYPAEHFYAIANLPNYQKQNLPCVRDFDSQSYMIETQSGFLCGWFELEAKPAFLGLKSLKLKDWKNYLENDVKHCSPLWDKVVHRMPILSKVTEPYIYNCPDNFTPDGRWILGECSEVKNYFVAVGMNGNTLQGAGGVGKEVAAWMIHGETTQELLPFNVQRFMAVHTNRYYLQQRIREIVGRHYGILYPHQCEYKYARKLRCSPLYSVLEDRGAIFGIKMGYERPIYFDSTYTRSRNKQPVMPQATYYKPKFFKFMQEEFQACKEGVGIIDMSSFSKIEIKSAKLEVVNYLQKLCSRDVNIPVGSILHTGMQNERGGYENDCMLVRISENGYFMVSPTLQSTRIYQWMSRHLPLDHSVVLNDVTSKYTVVNVVGPKANQLLSELSNSSSKLTPFTYRTMNVAYASDVMVMAFTHTGEPGYSLYIPSEYALHVYSRLMEVGRDYGVRDVGVLTQRLMRIERFIPFWAEELTPFVTPFEAGNVHCINMNKSFFIGKAALEAQKLNGVTKKLVMFVINNLDLDKNVWAWGGEPLYRNGQFVGTATSAGYGFNLNKLICLGFIRQPKSEERKIVTNEFVADPKAVYEIDIAGDRFPLTPHIHPLPIWNASNKSKKYTPTPVVAYSI